LPQLGDNDQQGKNGDDRTKCGPRFHCRRITLNFPVPVSGVRVRAFRLLAALLRVSESFV
jgi:hypothetical protein